MSKLMSDRARHLLSQLAAGNERIFADDALPPGWLHLERSGLAERVPGDRARLTERGIGKATELGIDIRHSLAKLPAITISIQNEHDVVAIIPTTSTRAWAIAHQLIAEVCTVQAEREPTNFLIAIPEIERGRKDLCLAIKVLAFNRTAALEIGDLLSRSVGKHARTASGQRTHRAAWSET